MIKVKTYSEFLEFMDNHENNEENKREYLRYLRDIVHQINDRINRDQSRMTLSELEAVETVSNYIEEMVGEK